MNAYAEYTSRLDALLNTLEWGHRAPERRDEVLHNLNGGAADALRDLVSSHDLWKSGAFFTPETLARLSLRCQDAQPPRLGGAVLDPAFGAGDLLLRWAETLPICRSLEKTLEKWGALLCGFELHREFISVAKRRLTLLAIYRGAKLAGKRVPIWQEVFPRLRQSDFTARKNAIPIVPTVVMNPPFTMMQSPKGCEWAKGAVNSAAVFVERILAHAPPNQRIIAILPEVLRSGTRYSRWRELVARKMSILRCESHGRFSDHADVDVFVLEGETHRFATILGNWPSPKCRTRRSTLADLAKVSVGPVVPHRHRKIGPNTPYITAKSLPAWKTVHRIPVERQFSGTLVAPPFVAVRRTSSPHDPMRAIGTIVAGKSDVSVENHLLVLRPKTGTIKDCRRILRSLKQRSTTTWLNKSIRCRHLTVKVLQELPLFEV